MVIRRKPAKTERNERGMLIAEIVVAMGILTAALLPLAFSIIHEQRLARAYYYQAVAMEIVDGEMEILRAGEWRAFRQGVQVYPVAAEAAKNLPPGKFRLTMDGERVRLEWLPEKRGQGGGVYREARVK